MTEARVAKKCVQGKTEVRTLRESLRTRRVVGVEDDLRRTGIRRGEEELLTAEESGGCQVN